MKRKFTLTAGGLALAAAYFVVSAMPVFSADTGTVNATVTAAAPCLQLSQSTPVDFGALDFSTPAYPSSRRVPAGTLLNCGPAEEDILAKGTGASAASGPAATWNLVDGTGVTGGNPCALATPNADKYFLRTDGLLSAADVFLDTADKTFMLNRPPGGITNIGVSVYMPCAGSTGAGVAMGFSYIFTATI